jgi:hypothetical protein
VLVDGQLQEMSLLILRRQVEEQKNRVGRSRARLQVGGALTVQSARALQAHKVGQEARKQLAKEARAARKAATEARKKLHQAGLQPGNRSASGRRGWQLFRKLAAQFL